MGASAGRLPLLVVCHACFALALIAVIACTPNSEDEDVASCGLPEGRMDREEGADDLIELVEEHASVYASRKLPGQELRQIYIPHTSGEPASFYYAPVPGKGEPMTAVFRDNLGQWQVAVDERVRLPEEMPLLHLADLRHGPETGVRLLEEAVPGVKVMGVSLVRGENCELRWHIGGTQGSGKEEQVIKAVLTDSSGKFEVTTFPYCANS